MVNLVLLYILPISARPIRTHEDGSLTALVHVEQRSVNRRYGFYLELDDATAGGVLVVPPTSLLRVELIEGFSGMVVVEKDYDPQEFDGLPGLGDPLGLISTDRGELPYWIVPGTDTEWWVVHANEGIVVVPAGLLGELGRNQ